MICGVPIQAFFINLLSGSWNLKCLDLAQFIATTRFLLIVMESALCNAYLIIFYLVN